MDQPNPYAKINNAALVILAICAGTMALIYTKAVLVPFVFSIFIYSVLQPIMAWLCRRWKVPRWAALTLTSLFFVLVLSLLVLSVASSLQSFLQGAHVYRGKVLELVRWGSEMAGRVGFAVDSESLRSAVGGLPVFSFAQNLTGGLLSFIGNVFLVLIFVLFLILGSETQKKPNELFEEIQLKISKYVSAKFGLSLLTGVLVGIILWIFGVELAFMIAVLTFLLNFIPNIGSIVATALPLPILFLQSGFNWKFFVVLGLAGLVQFLVGNVIEPKLLGESMDLHPVTVLLFLVFWGLVWGIPGMFLAVPITAIMKIIFGRIETTKGFAELLAGRLPN